ncbi:MAG: GFA family protein [Woeseiaceae bacterium]
MKHQGQAVEIEKSSMTGQCACGHVRYRMTAQPMIVHCCHCRYCQRETGSSFVLNALVEADRVEIDEGEVEGIDTPTSSGRGQRIMRCPRCQVALWSHYAYGDIGKLIRFVRVGTLDDPDALPPDVHIFVESKQPWVEIPDGAAVFERFYRAGEVWTRDSLARRQALFAQQ